MLVLVVTSIAICLGGAVYIFGGLSHLSPLLSPTKTTRISFPTRELSGTRATALLVYHIIRSVLRRIGLGLKLDIKQEVDAQYTLQNADISLDMPFRITPHDIQRYIQCLSSNTSLDVDDILDSPHHMQLLLSALTEPAMLLLLSKINCPIDPVGSVNVRNAFELKDPSTTKKTLRERLGSQSSTNRDAVPLNCEARLSREVKQVKRGWEFTIMVDLVEALQEARTTIYTQAFTFLVFHFHKHSQPPPASTKADEIEAETCNIAGFRIGAREPSSWADLSKDYNPIHTSTFAARLLGFRSKIAHGNHVVAKAIHGAASYLERGPIDALDGTGIRRMEVEFKRPVPVPSSLETRVPEDDDKEHGRKHLEIWVNGKVATTVTCS
ncbi:uncharacterized protein I303_103761 [Kwoniella dejecticola CBS 10117]|uniref:MaoC-like domain-containing protein n=1 Tax=Kwoniella dejecticola CBS 10117 TaxID=1296121 RepID=A0A1A6A7M9_9TREE|nr:uncharacterized protein I303_03779 [Kwoniella dejecticola CBS 10117]OBR86061.1 hypothetical protein I303_03779 [Kwoniella dejecticola CBS 10117]